MKSKITIMIVCVLMVCIGIATRSGAGETYDLNGEWDTVFDLGPYGVVKDIVKISQQGNTFVGIILIGSNYIVKGEEVIKGELIDKMISQVQIANHKDDASGELFWNDAQGVIIEKGNKIVIQSYIRNFFVETLSMTRKH